MRRYLYLYEFSKYFIIIENVYKKIIFYVENTNSSFIYFIKKTH